METTSRARVFSMAIAFSGAVPPYRASLNETFPFLTIRLVILLPKLV